MFGFGKKCKLWVGNAADIWTHEIGQKKALPVTKVRDGVSRVAVKSLENLNMSTFP